MKTVLVIGIGAGHPDYITIQAIKALNRCDVVFLMDKGPSKDSLIDLRRQLCERYLTERPYRFVEAQTPERERGEVDYQASVKALNREKQQVFERLIDQELEEGQTGAFLALGDPALYDSTLRILQRILAAGTVQFDYQVIPGITSVQALAAQHKVPLNRIGRSLEITTGRRLAAGQGGDADTRVVMLDAEDSYRQLRNQDLDIYWGAYLGTADEILIAGRLDEVADEIRRVRLEARQAHGWIMDTYLLRKPED